MQIFFLLFVLHGISPFAGAQTLPEPLRKAEALRLDYQFKEAAAIFSTIAEQSQDSVLRRQAAHQLLLCENGQVMLHYIETPVVTGKKVVPTSQFFNYYTIDLPGEWAALPANLLQAKTNDALSPVFIPATDADILYIASQATGDWDIYVLRRIEGDQWATPEPLEAINTTFDERFPYITPDGQTLYFASNGHSGMGGYDLFKSTFNTATQQWGTPENLGFPYSSPFDDWLFVPNTNYTEALFTSSREQKADSLTVYRIALEVNPTKQQGRSTLQIQQIAKLQPVKNELQTDEDVTPEENPNDQYQALHRILHQQQVNESLVQDDLTSIRTMYALVDDPAERETIQTKINDYENELLQMQASIRQTMERIRKIEAGLLEQGITPEFVPAVSAPASTLTGPAQSMPRLLYFKPATVFPAKHILPSPKQTEEDGKYIFKIEQTSHVFTNPPVTAGLVYRIQIGSFSRKLPQKELKGLSPVFIQQGKKLFIHYAGQFNTYEEADNALPRVKKQGFYDALIIALIDGKKTPIKIAREYEETHKVQSPPPVQVQSQLPPQPQPPTVTAPAKNNEAASASAGKAVYNVLLGEYPEKLPQELRQAIQQHTNKDIIRKSSKEKTMYIVGPFSAFTDAEKLQAQLKTKGFEVTIE
ncbi:MAG: hypothetical protein LBN98_04395 [Prevotellaceae bacterium]|nr:hypothetical protein [Prevotellaceae bacterium]